MPKITPFLWFDSEAEEAMHYYCSIFPNAKPGEVVRSAPGGVPPEGAVLIARFELEGQQFVALNGGPHFKFTEAVSFYVDCEDQAEVDRLWDRLTRDGGEPGQCGWLKDKYGLSWQIVPKVMTELLADPDPARAGRATQAMLKMTKLDVAALKAAAAGN
jgi:predicted 3-demethylubiquinone-9 3-methyltransferase (glyoxalase superfamily)